MRDIQLLFNCGMGPAKVEEMIIMAKREFVMSHHPRDIFRLPPSSSWKNGCYKTFTKDERMHPHNGRFIPITEDARRVIGLAMAIPEDTPYLFHEKICSKMIPTDGYAQNLRKRCRKLGCIPINNHAFRMAFSSRLIELSFSASDRALILGHEVQTNESHYSLTDKRRLDDIKERLK